MKINIKLSFLFISAIILTLASGCAPPKYISNSDINSGKSLTYFDSVSSENGFGRWYLQEIYGYKVVGWNKFGSLPYYAVFDDNLLLVEYLGYMTSKSWSVKPTIDDLENLDSIKKVKADAEAQAEKEARARAEAEARVGDAARAESVARLEAWLREKAEAEARAEAAERVAAEKAAAERAAAVKAAVERTIIEVAAAERAVAERAAAKKAAAEKAVAERIKEKAKVAPKHNFCHSFAYSCKNMTSAQISEFERRNKGQIRYCAGVVTNVEEMIFSSDYWIYVDVNHNGEADFRARTKTTQAQANRIYRGNNIQIEGEVVSIDKIFGHCETTLTNTVIIK